MFEITHCDDERLDYYIYERIAYPKARYDFTFENRYLIYHAPVKHVWYYIALDMKTNLSSQILESKTPIDITDEMAFVPKIYSAIKYTGDRRYLDVMIENPLDVIDSIFRIILPTYGYSIREEQIELCKTMYNGFKGHKISLCEAEVGTGKSLAYLIAAVVAKKNNVLTAPITISTATIELQKALIEKEIPKLSKMLQDFALINKPLKAVIRKGKEHYFCKARYENYFESIKQYPNKYKNAIAFLKASQLDKTAFDLDKMKLPSTLKRRICVKDSCYNCKYAKECRYQHYITKVKNDNDIFFQVTNHNMFLTSEKMRLLDHDGILKYSPYVIIDEAHKLKEAANDVFGVTITEKEIYSCMNKILNNCTSENKNEIKAIIQPIKDLSRNLFTMLKSRINNINSEDSSNCPITINGEIRTTLQRLSKQIESLEYKLKKKQSFSRPQLKDSIERIINSANNISWASIDCEGNIELRCCPKNIANTIYKKIWDAPINYILTSGTMSDGKDFEFFKRENGVSMICNELVQESSTPSPYNYRKNTRLYIPSNIPKPDNNDPNYITAIATEVIRLVNATNGHTAILFTSYKVLQRVYEYTKDKLEGFELICMNRGNKTAITDFKKSKNGVIFASGPMWEGIDCVGDCLSSVIIVRLPFPIRSTLLNEKKAAKENVQEFIQEYAVPEMIIKLRQGIGRLVRSENDTGLISILDSRATDCYYSDVIRKTLAKYPRVKSIDEITDFFKSVKTESYFEK